MIITLTIIIGTSIGVGSTITGGIIGYLIGRRRTENQLDVEYERLIEYYTPPQTQYEVDRRSVYSN